MASHAAALFIAYLAYIFARRYARDARFSFGTGKINSLAGFTGALLLVGFAVAMVWESIERFLQPVPIQFNQAILVAVLGLIVNAVSAIILGHQHDSGTQHQPAHDHHHHHHNHYHHDHNLRSAYLHVIADALTSLLAIFALLAGKYFGATWLDPAMGVVGALLVARWSVGLIRGTSRVLLDWQAPRELQDAVAGILTETGHTSVTDLHIWTIAPGRYAAMAEVHSDRPRTPDEYRARLAVPHPELVHVTIEVHLVPDSSPEHGRDAVSVPESVSSHD
jgi:cation diffusion facilitator family transporter